MEELYDFKGIEPKITEVWEEKANFSPEVLMGRRPYSMFLAPPNASGPLHIGNALMVAIQDVLARYHRAKGEPTLWIPGTDHGGYETQVTFEREMGEAGKARHEYTRDELCNRIAEFVTRNNATIEKQLRALGASVDWSRQRFTLDERSLSSVHALFTRMVAQGLVYRKPYMVHYCPLCATVLADIELKKVEENAPLYFVRFNLKDEEGGLTFATSRPEYIFSITHALIHPEDDRYAAYIGKVLINPATGSDVAVVASKRKFKTEDRDAELVPFYPSFDRYDYEYALRNDLPCEDNLDWEGNLTLRHRGQRPEDIREMEVASLEERGAIEQVKEEHVYESYLCKKGHRIINIIRHTWFLKIDDEQTPLRAPVLQAIKEERLSIEPQWRMKGLTEWIGKMHDWPIARQNAWGIRIPLWYEIEDTSSFMVWFFDRNGVRQNGSLQSFLDKGHTFEEISKGLERVYAPEDASWTLTPQEGRRYLPETDTFDTWLSSGAWGSIVYGDSTSPEFEYFYPSDILVVGHDLIRIWVARMMLLTHYLTGKLPFKYIYFHRLIKGEDGQKMSKSLGNVVSLDHYLEKYGADVTRMGLISQTGGTDDFMLPDELFAQYRSFIERLWRLGRIGAVIQAHQATRPTHAQPTPDERALQNSLTALFETVGGSVERLKFAEAQQRATSFLVRLESHFNTIHARPDIEAAAATAMAILKSYLVMLHPFMPFVTESVYGVFREEKPLASERWAETRPTQHRRG